jgi:NTP pyrophosphatase (non-canonical NTP hydrolase)
MQPLPKNASLHTIQDSVRKLEVERGFQDRSAVDQCLKLFEEARELSRAVGALSGQPIDPQGRIADLGGEAVDVLLMPVAVVNRYDVDLEEAFRRKEERNSSRHWR